MKPLVTYKKNLAHIGNHSLLSLAKKHGTPIYIYSKSFLSAKCDELQKAFHSHPTRACFALKANPNPQLIRILFKKGFGADVVSLGELERALQAGANPNAIVFSGVGKKRNELERAIELGLLSINVESIQELEVLGQLSKKHGKEVAISLRMNPNINVKTNPYIATGLYKTKFGLPENQIPDALSVLKKYPVLKLRGLSCHLGSQIKSVKPYEQSAKRLVHLADSLKEMGFSIELLDLGGGFGVSYQGEKVPTIAQYSKTILSVLKKTSYRLVIEPGRWLVAECGILLSEVIYTKSNPHKNFLIVDASMTELIRPALYHAYHPIFPCKKTSGKNTVYDVVGPVCETSDFLGLKRKLPPIQSGDFIWIGLVGAYGSSMASEYNLRPKAFELIVD